MGFSEHAAHLHSHVVKLLLAKRQQEGLVEDTSGFTLLDLVDVVRQGKYNSSQVARTANCLNKVLTLIDPQALMNESRT